MGHGAYPHRWAIAGDGVMPKSKQRSVLTCETMTDTELLEFENFIRSIAAERRYFQKMLGVPDDEPRSLGETFRPFAHETATDLRKILNAVSFVNADHVWGLAVALEEAKAKPQLDKICVPVPLTLVASAVAILSSLPRAQRGRPRDLSTDEAVKLAAKLKSVRAAAKIIAAATGKSEETVRSNIRGAKKRSKKGRV
jgi:hypothetical protein